MRLVRSRCSSRASEYFQISPPAMYAALTCDQLLYAWCDADCGHQHRQPHHIEDVNLQKRLGKRTAADDERLKAEEKRETQNLPAPATSDRRGLSRCQSFAESRACGECHRHAREEEKQRSAESADDDGPLVGTLGSIGQAHPRIEQVRFHHDQHGDAAQPVEISSAAHGSRDIS